MHPTTQDSTNKLLYYICTSSAIPSSPPLFPSPHLPLTVWMNRYKERPKKKWKARERESRYTSLKSSQPFAYPWEGEGEWGGGGGLQLLQPVHSLVEALQDVWFWFTRLLHTKLPLILSSCNSLPCLETKLRKLFAPFQTATESSGGDTNHIRGGLSNQGKVQCLLRWLACLHCS